MTKELKAYFDGQKDTLKAIKLKIKLLIKFHEDRIEELIERLETIKIGIKDNQLSWGESDWVFSEIDFHYESIMAIEKEFEGVI